MAKALPKHGKGPLDAREAQRIAREADGLAVYGRLLSYVLPYWPYALAAVLAMVVAAGTNAGFVAALRPLLDGGFVEQDATVIQLIALLIVGLLIAHGLAFFLSTFLTNWISRQMVKRIRSQVFDRLLRLPTGYYDHSSSGRLLSKLTYEVEQVSKSATDAVATIIRDGLTAIFLIGYMFWLSGWLAAIFFLAAPLLIGIVAYVTKRFRKISRRIHKAVGGVAHVAEEVIEAHQVVKAFGGEARERSRFEEANERNRRMFMKFIATKAAAVPIVQVVAGLALAVVIYVATFDAVIEAVTVGTFVSFVAAAMMLNRPLKSLTKVNALLQKGIAAGESLFQVIDAETEVDRGTVTLGRAEGCIAYRGVRFAYSPDKGDVLHGVDLDVAPGEMVALVGRSGSGKTTLVNLLPRFYEPREGAIHLDGHDIRDYPLADLRRQIALVGQHVTLFNDTVGANIAYGAAEPPSREQVWGAAQAAQAAEFIEGLPEGLDTVVGENGVLLSGGQRQRIAIARAILKDAPILILDEATSALDTESEQLIQRALEGLMVGRTTLVIAHRLSTIQKADRIVFIQDGHVLEQGRHEELLARDGRYAALHRLQFAQQARAAG